MFDDSVTYEKPISAPRADRGPLELFVPEFNRRDTLYITTARTTACSTIA